MPRKKTTPDVPKHVTTIDDGQAFITPVNPGDVEAIARLLIENADTPASVRTTTGPAGWLVPEKIAKAAGLI